MKIKDGFLLRQFGEESIVVAVGEGSEDFNKLITLNSVGAFIFEKLSGDITRDELAQSLVDRYEVDRKTAERDTDLFIEKLKEAGLLDA
jgi:hypothetical protein